MGRKGKKKVNEGEQSGGSQQQQGPPASQQRAPAPQQQQQGLPTPQQQPQQRPPGPQQQQQQRPPAAQQQRPPAPQQQQQQRPPAPQQQQHQQRPPTPQQLQQQRPPAPQQQQHQQRPPTPQQPQQQRPPAPQQQQHQQRPPVPQQQQHQQRPPAPQQQQQQRPPAWQQQQQQQRPPTPQQPQQQNPPAPQQQQHQQRPPTPQQPQQQRPPAPQQQQHQQRPPAPQQQQQQRPPAPQQQQHQQRPPAPQQQQQQRPPARQQQQQQQRPPTPQQPQQQNPPAPQQQQHQQRPPTPQQPQQQRPPAPQQQQHQQRPPAPQQQQQQRPPAPQQQQHQQRPPAPQQQQQQRPPARQQQQQQQRPPTPQQPQQQNPPAPQQWQHQQRPPTPQQQLPQQIPPAPQQQQPQQRPPAPQQQQPQQRQSVPQKQKPSGSQQLQQPSVTETAVAIRSGRGKSVLSAALHQMYLDQIPRKSTSSQPKEGRKITVETNMLRLIFPPNFQTEIVHYDVVITPDKPKFLLRPVFEEFRKKHFPNRYPAFDGRKNAYSAKYLPFGTESIEDEITIFDHEFMREKKFKIYLKKAALLDLSWLKSLQYGKLDNDQQQMGVQALDIILRHGPAYKFTTVGRSLFPQPLPGRVESLSNGLDLWIGVFQSVVIGSKPYLNMDVAHKGFPTPQSIINLMKELCQDPRSHGLPENITPRDVEHNEDKINKFLKGLKVQYEIPGQPTTKRTYRVNALVQCPRQNKFKLEDQTCTVEQYFLKMKNYKIQYPELPCVWVGSRNTNIHLPVELCTIVGGQVTQKKLDEAQTTNMIRKAATNTHTRKEKIMNGFAKMNLNEQPILTKEFHLSVQGEFEKVPARVLEPPALQYHNQMNVKVFKGTWRAAKFLVPCELPENSWTILNLDKFVRERDLHDGLHNKLQQGGQPLNMTIGRAQTPFVTLSVQGRITNIKEYFEEKKKQNIRLVVVIIPNLNNAYSLVKQISELRIPGGIVTQCIKSQTLRKLSESTIGNILLKINSKLNGINHTFARTHRPLCLSSPCMIVGADVTHPSPDAVDIPSIAAVAASHDPNAFKYNIELRLQSPREEMIQDLEEIMVSQLKFFYTQTGHKPNKIVFYRDGVSEGQLTQVMHFELAAIKKAIARLEGSTERKIAISFFVVQKRHHIRLFPTDQRNSDDRNFNVQAGTIVDTEITHPTHIDFYLVSHASIQGTARPTKYRCICNEMNMSENEIEQLTYYLCHMFARCTRSVSYPAPTYYAHLAAFRARALIHNVPLNINNLQEEQRRNMSLQINKNSPMFFV